MWLTGIMVKKPLKKPRGMSGRPKRGDDRRRAELRTQSAEPKKQAQGGSVGSGTARVSATKKRPTSSAAKEVAGAKAAPTVDERAGTQSTSRIRVQAPQNSDLTGLIQHETVALIRGEVEECIRGGIAEIREEVTAALHAEARKVARWLSRHCKAVRGELSSTNVPPGNTDAASHLVADVEDRGPLSSDAIRNSSSRPARDDARADAATRETDATEVGRIGDRIERAGSETDADRRVIADLYRCRSEKPYDLLVLMYEAGAIASRSNSGEWDFSAKAFRWNQAYPELNRRTVDKIRKYLRGEDLFVIEPDPIPVSEEAANNAKRRTREISRGGYLTPRGARVAREEHAIRQARQRGVIENQ